MHELPSVNVYVMMKVPVPEVEGSKFPPLTFVPENVPPDGLAPDRLSDDEYVQSKSVGKFKFTLGNPFTAIGNIAAAEFPQVLFAVIVIFPLVELAVVVIEFVVDVPLHPLGNVHVYDVAPATAATE